MAETDDQNSGAKAALQGRVIKVLGGLYTVFSESGEEVLAKPRGIFRNDGIKVLPGDIVCCMPSGDADIPFRIERILERKNELIRPLMSNLDFIFIVISKASPDPDFFLLDKLLIYAAKLKIKAGIIVSKTDLCLDTESENFLSDNFKAYRDAGYKVFFYSREKSDSEIKAYISHNLKSGVFALAGASGSGKSSLLNRLIKEEKMETGGISKKLRRGKHTTRHVELIPYMGGFVSDTPGFSSLSVNDLSIEYSDLDKAFPDFAELKNECRYKNCKHDREPGCALKKKCMIAAYLRERAKRYAILASSILNSENFRKRGR